MLGDNYFEGVLSPGKAIFDSVDLGLSVDEITIENEKDYTDIIAMQYGTKPIDKIQTGELWMVTLKLTDYSIAQLAKVLTGMTVSAGGNAAKKGTDCYESMYDKAKLLIIKRTDCDNVVSTDEDYWLNFPKAYPLNDSDILTMSPGSQQSFEVKFICFKDRDSGSASEGNFWWSGQASTALA